MEKRREREAGREGESDREEEKLGMIRMSGHTNQNGQQNIKLHIVFSQNIGADMNVNHAGLLSGPLALCSP